MAQIINRKTPQIIANNRHSGLDFITITDKGFYFPKAVCFSLGISLGKYVHFVNDGDYWAFYINKDNDGFPFNMEKKGVYRLNDRALSRMFLQSTKRKATDRLLIKITKSRNDGQPIYEIHTKETIDEIITKEIEAKKKKEYTLKLRNRGKLPTEINKN